MHVYAGHDQFILFSVHVGGGWGWDAVPDAVALACVPGCYCHYVIVGVTSNMLLPDSEVFFLGNRLSSW